MPKPHDEKPAHPDTVLHQAFQRYFPALAALVWRKRGAHLFTSFTVRHNAGSYLVIVRAFDSDNWRGVVVFGSGPTVADALRNAALAIGKGQWRVDKPFKVG